MVLFALGCMNHIPEEMVHEKSKLPDNIDYNFHVKPILSDKCFACHGPDAGNRKANLRLDFNQKFLKDTDQQVLTFDDVKSEIPNRLLSIDPNIKMPPPESHLNLSDREIATILKWMDQEEHTSPTGHSFRLQKVKYLKSKEMSGWKMKLIFLKEKIG